MSYYELYNANAFSSEPSINTTNLYELYHHGVKGQKWGVRREQRRSQKRAARSAKAESAIQRSRGRKGIAAWKRVGRGVLRHLGQNFLLGVASTPLVLAAASTAAAAPVAGVFVASLAGMALNVQNVYSTVRDTWDIASHEDVSKFLIHCGVSIDSILINEK